MEEIIFISLQKVIQIHIAQIELFGGSHGIRDLGLLQSAIATPQAQFDSTFLHKDLFDMAAAYMFHIIKNHPFLDGNKRTGIATGFIFLHRNDSALPWTKNEAYELGFHIATSAITKDQVAEILRKSAS